MRRGSAVGSGGVAEWVAGSAENRPLDGFMCRVRAASMSAPSLDLERELTSTETYNVHDAVIRENTVE